MLREIMLEMLVVSGESDNFHQSSIRTILMFNQLLRDHVFNSPMEWLQSTPCRRTWTKASDQRARNTSGSISFTGCCHALYRYIVSRPPISAVLHHQATDASKSCRISSTTSFSTCARLARIIRKDISAGDYSRANSTVEPGQIPPVDGLRHCYCQFTTTRTTRTASVQFLSCCSIISTRHGSPERTRRYSKSPFDCQVRGLLPHWSVTSTSDIPLESLLTLNQQESLFGKSLEFA